ncbi:MAG: hypothetical protein V4710_09600 [Verrucomicrobiota bacterium]
MRERSPSRSAKPALDLIEEATHLLRGAPFNVLLAYYAGTVPALLGFLYFFTDMSQGAFARSHLVEASLAMAFLYLWMKCWQSVFATGLRNWLAMAPATSWSWDRLARLIVVQCTVQPTGLFLRIIAAQILLPYIWVYGFYQSVGVLGAEENGRTGAVMKRAARLASLWPLQAHAALLLLFLFAFFVAINTAAGVMLVSQLLKMFFNVETVFSRSPVTILNTTVLSVIIAVTYLVFDPLRKALYVVRCFRGDALQSGEDLRVELKALKNAAGRMTVLIALFFALPHSGMTAEEEKTAAPVARQIDPRQIQHSITQVMERREYAWRLPRSENAVQQKGWLSSFLNDSLQSLRQSAKAAREKVKAIMEAIREWLGKKDWDSDSSTSGRFSPTAHTVFYTSIALLIVTLVILLRFIGRKKKEALPAVPEAEPAAPDLRSDDLVADQLPEEGWLKLARELMASGELRLALRASYLAGLAHLGTRQLLTIARHKSNHDYDRELRRRARQKQSLVSAFEMNMHAFERAWYGLHEVTPETLERFNGNLERIREC